MNVTPPCGAGSSVVASTAAPSLGTPALSGARQTSVRSAWSATKTVTGMPYCRMYGGLTGIVESRLIRRRSHEYPSTAVVEGRRNDWCTGGGGDVERRLSIATGAVDGPDPDAVGLARPQAFEVVLRRTR